MSNIYIIASQHPWNRELPDRLRARTGDDFVLIDDFNELIDSKVIDKNPKYIFFVHWSSRIPESIWKRFNCIIFHMTDVPYGRGGSPLQNLIIRGHESTQISAIQCVETLDSGSVYLKKFLSLQGSAEEIFVRADQIIEDMIFEIIETNPIPLPQVGEPVLFKRRKPEDGDLRSAQTIEQVYDWIRMLDAGGYPNAFLEVNGLRFEFKNACLRFNGVEASVFIRKVINESNL